MGSIFVDPSERPHPHLESTIQTWRLLQHYRKTGHLSINGRDLDIAGVVAVSRYNCLPSVERSRTVLAGIEESLETLNSYLANGSYLYGVNTGFGGSADVRTKDLLGLQVALMQHTQSAVIIADDRAGTNHEELGSHVMPSPWVKGTMLLRCNANIRGHSAMTLSVAEAMIELVRNDCTPLVPLRGTVSASGDLMPLSYVAGSIMGCPDIYVRMGKRHDNEIVTADKALEMLNMKPIVLGPKEGLSLINGTAPSAAVASLAIYEANNLAVICQLLTVMASEAQAANVEWAHEFISDVRPHQGQVEVARNVRKFLSGSKLVLGLSRPKDRFKVGLVQERYPLRSMPQWVSPIIEDLLSAQNQISCELNATSDNPVVNVEQNDVHCGANFQAAAITMASEKIRLCLQMLGKLLFSQTTELINNTMNNGLPPNLAADDPSLSFCLKGVDVNIAAYQSELAYLASPVSSHVQSAEMHNQAVNSLALLSSRYTMQSVELLSLMCAASIYTMCQALDLRVMHITFLESFRPVLYGILGACFELEETQASDLREKVFKEICTSWYASACYDAHERTAKAASDIVVFVADFMAETEASTSAQLSSYKSLQVMKTKIGSAMLEHYRAHRANFFKEQTTPEFLGAGSKQIYCFVRLELGVPFHQGLVEQPSPADLSGNMLNGRSKKTIGSWVSMIYEAMRDGRVIEQIMRLNPVSAETGTTSTYAAGKTEHNGHDGNSLHNGLNGHTASKDARQAELHHVTAKTT